MDIFLLNAKYDWLNLRFQDNARVSDYKSTLFRISSESKLCGVDFINKDVLEKILITFHTSNVVLQQQY